MVRSVTKNGRPRAVYRASWGERVPDLYKLSDGRWRLSGPEKTTFSEADERIAVMRAQALLAERRGSADILVPKASAKMSDIVAVRQALDSLGIPAAGIPQPLSNPFQPRLVKPSKGQPILIKADDDELTVYQGLTQRKSFGIWLRKLILQEGKLAAELTGIETLAHLGTVKPPAPSAKLSALLTTYTAKPKLSANEITRSKTFWTEFVKAVGVAHIGEVGHDQIVAYEGVVRAMGLSTKSDHHRFTKIKTIIAFGLRRGLDIEGCRRALDATALLDAQHKNQSDPRPIEPAAFWRVYTKAKDAGDNVYAALMLTALCTCSYGGEVASMKWSEIDLKAGTYIGRRPKTGVSRVATLWPQIVAALKKIPKRDGVDAIFNTNVRSHTILSVLRSWRRYRKAAGYGEELTFGQIRDAAYSIACQNASLDQAKALAGHRFPGMADAYVRRRPDFVASACAAVGAEFQVAKHA